MSIASLRVAFLVVLGVGLSTQVASAAEDQERQRFFERAAASLPPTSAGDRTLAPYLFVNGGDREHEVLPLKHTDVSIHVAGALANVHVAQTYRNDGKDTLEALYLFPLSTRAAVHAMRMTIGERVIEAKIREKQQARDTYEKARASGQSASLLEQLRPNVFQMNVANLQPGDELKIELSYVERIVPEAQVYELVFPTVVGPRYSNVSASQARADERWVENPYLASGVRAPQTLTIAASIDSAIPVADVQSPSHALTVHYASKQRAEIAVAGTEERGNRDFVLRYRLGGGKIETGALVSESGDEHFFSVTVAPPARVEPKQIVAREYVFLVDISGSMSGFPTRIAEKLMHELFASLRPQDSFNVLTFAGAIDALAEVSLPATRANVQLAASFLASRHAGGGTELLPALRRALALPRQQRTARVVAIVTDGYVSVEREAFDVVRGALGEANLFAFGIGRAVNRHLIEGLARAGSGESFVVDKPDAAEREAQRFADYIRAPVLTNVRVSFEGLQVYDVATAELPDVFAARPIVVQGKYRGATTGRVIVTGQTADGPYRATTELANAGIITDGSLAYLWARERLALLSDQAKPEELARDKLAVTALGLKYHLMTEFTSFVAVDSLQRRKGSSTVQQPLPTPSGVDSSSTLSGLAGSRHTRSSNGAMGYGLLGGGAGGGGSGAGGLGLGSIGTIGHGSGSGTGYGFGRGRVGKGALGAAAPTVTGSLDAELIRRHVRSYLGELTERLRSSLALRGTPGVTGRVMLKLVLRPDGKIADATIESSTLGDPILDALIVSMARTWVFPAVPGGGTTVINYPLVLAL